MTTCALLRAGLRCGSMFAASFNDVQKHHATLVIGRIQRASRENQGLAGAVLFERCQGKCRAHSLAVPPVAFQMMPPCDCSGLMAISHVHSKSPQEFDVV